MVFIDVYIVLFYFGIPGWLSVAAAGRAGEKPPVPGSSPWRLRAPRLMVAAAPVLFVAAVPLGMIGGLWVFVGALSLSAALPWFALVAAVVEWVRRSRAASSVSCGDDHRQLD